MTTATLWETAFEYADDSDRFCQDCADDADWTAAAERAAETAQHLYAADYAAVSAGEFDIAVQASKERELWETKAWCYQQMAEGARKTDVWPALDAVRSKWRKAESKLPKPRK